MVAGTLFGGMILGLIFGTGALGNFLIGWLSESIGLGAAFQLVTGAVLIAAVLALFLPVEQRSVAIVPETDEAVPTSA